MGFGLLFAGYITLLTFKIIPIGVIGAPLMLAGLTKLCRHEAGFKPAKVMSAVMTVYFAVFLVLRILNLTGYAELISEKAKDIVIFSDELIYYVIFFLFGLFLNKGLFKICTAVGYEKGIRKVRLCSAFLNVVGLGSVVRFALYFTKYGPALRAPLLLFELLCLIFTSILIYSCYMMIATQQMLDDEQEKIKKYDERHTKKLK